MDVPSFLLCVIILNVQNMCLISSFNLSGFHFQPLANFIHLSLLHSTKKKKMVHVKLGNMWKIWVLITAFMHNIGLRTVVACLHVSSIIPCFHSLHLLDAWAFWTEILLIPSLKWIFSSRSEQNAGSFHWMMEEWLEKTVFPTTSPHHSAHF